jgi:hypothetical protein
MNKVKYISIVSLVSLFNGYVVYSGIEAYKDFKGDKEITVEKENKNYYKMNSCNSYGEDSDLRELEIYIENLNPYNMKKENLISHVTFYRRRIKEGCYSSTMVDFVNESKHFVNTGDNNRWLYQVSQELNQEHEYSIQKKVET